MELGQTYTRTWSVAKTAFSTGMKDGDDAESNAGTIGLPYGKMKLTADL